MTENSEASTPGGVTRRRLLGGAGAIAGLAAASIALPPNISKAIASPLPKPGKLEDIKHVVMLMQENRSFDHYYGALSGGSRLR
jgi:phospholipase C